LDTILQRGEHVTDRDVRQAISVVVDIEAVDCVGMERVGRRICIEDDHGPCPVSGRLERVEVAEVESLVPERRTEIESSKMVRHFFSPLKIEDAIALSDRIVTNGRFNAAPFFFTTSELVSEARAHLSTELYEVEHQARLRN
jgi:hypothetical protein